MFFVLLSKENHLFHCVIVFSYLKLDFPLFPLCLLCFLCFCILGSAGVVSERNGGVEVEWGLRKHRKHNKHNENKGKSNSKHEKHNKHNGNKGFCY